MDKASKSGDSWGEYAIGFSDNNMCPDRFIKSVQDCFDPSKVECHIVLKDECSIKFFAKFPVLVATSTFTAEYELELKNAEGSATASALASITSTITGEKKYSTTQASLCSICHFP